MTTPTDKSEVSMPGAWICDKCKFILQKNILHAGDGSLSADTSPLNEICPNDGKLMRPFTWREANEGYAEENTRLQSQLTDLRAQVDHALSQAVSNGVVGGESDFKDKDRMDWLCSDPDGEVSFTIRDGVSRLCDARCLRAAIDEEISKSTSRIQACEVKQ